MTLHELGAAERIEDGGPAGTVVPPPRAYSLRAAMIVPGLGVLILAVFIGAGLLTSNPVQPAKSSTAPHAVGGTTIEAVPAVRALSVITVNGQPPGNIVNAVSIPRGAIRISFENNTAAATQYDAQIGLSANDTQGALVTFFRAVMNAQGWHVFEVGPASHSPGTIEVLGKKAGSDSFYWEFGAVIAPTTFGSGAPATGRTSFTVRLFQVPDPA
jgi:hypothetical protein